MDDSLALSPPLTQVNDGQLLYGVIQKRVSKPHSEKERLSKCIEKQCESCGRPVSSKSLDRVICKSCYLREWRSKRPTERCELCGRLAPKALNDRAICQRCYDKERLAKRPTERCELCGCLAPNALKGTAICQRCYERKKHTRPAVRCGRCGRLALSKLKGRDICHQCFYEERNGRTICQGCHKVKVIVYSAQTLCRECNTNRFSKVQLLKYLESYTTPFLYNQELFTLLTDHLDWENATQSTYKRFKYLGEFLQQHSLKAPLSWQAIDSLLSGLKPAKGPKLQYIRSGLLEIGHRLAASQLLESREMYVAMRGALAPIAKAPEAVQSLLQGYGSYLIKRKLSLSTLRSTMAILAFFWFWCLEREINSPELVSDQIIKLYLQSFTNKWKCSKCHKIIWFDPQPLAFSPHCEGCNADHPIKQVPCNQHTICSHLAALRGFFRWAKVNRFIATNPVHGRFPRPAKTIQHYPSEVIRRLHNYIAGPDTDPAEAFVLYLILFHALTHWEIRHAQMPDVVSPLSVKPASLAEAYYILVPKRLPSKGKHSVGRPSRTISFPRKAASWLQPLLRRFEQSRQQMVKSATNHFIFFVPDRSRLNVPVSTPFITQLVQGATTHAMNSVCTARTLRKTVGVHFVGKYNPAILRWMGWSPSQSFNYTWMNHVIIEPPPSTNF